jgi:hypothetical protein
MTTKPPFDIYTYSVNDASVVLCADGSTVVKVGDQAIVVTVEQLNSLSRVLGIAMKDGAGTL